MIGRSHKDTMFRFLFGTEENKANALELYNAINGSHYGNPDEIEITTLEDVVFIGMRNDVSFAFHSQMVFWEHQSTPNPNMPLRFLLYLSEVYSKRLNELGANVNGGKPIPIEAPRFVVFYNGLAKMPDKSETHLSDMFISGQGDIELTTTVFNINEGHNREIMGACKTLADYARLVSIIRSLRKSMSLGDAVEAAIEQCKREGVLVDYLDESSHSNIVQILNSDIWEYDMETLSEQVFESGYEDGYEQGKAEGAKAESGRITQALQELGVSSDIIAQAIPR